MKCQKCQAENINEAVKCGICGTRLKHYETHDDFTGNKQVQSSVRRDTKKAQSTHPNRNQKQTQNVNIDQNQSITDKIFDKNIRIEDKARILLDSWQEKAKEALTTPQRQQKKKNNKWLFIIIAIFIFGSPIIGVITRVIIPEIKYQVREHLRIARENEQAQQDMSTDEATVVTDAVAVVGGEYDQRYAEMHAYTQNVERVFDQTHKLPKDLREIEKFDDVQFSDSIHNEIEVKNGVIMGKFEQYPDQKIYLKPEIKNNKIKSWTCFKVGISNDEMSDCELVPTAPLIE